MNEPSINDLKVLLTLLEECHVSRSAEKLNITQSAASKSLARMRTYMDDQLMVRQEGQYRLSDRAQLAIPRLKSILNEVSSLKQMTPELAPGAKRQFKISMLDDLTVLMLPELINMVTSAAPNTTLLVSDSGTRVYGRLQFGDIDIAIEVMPTAGSGFETMRLFDWPLRVVIAENNPLAQGELTPERYAAAKHGIVALAGNGVGQIDHALADLGLSRNVVVVTRHFSSIPAMAERSGLVFALPYPVALSMTDRHPLVLRELPVSVSPLFIGAVWHSRNNDDPEQIWFRKVLEICAAQVSLKYQ